MDSRPIRQATRIPASASTLILCATVYVETSHTAALKGPNVTRSGGTQHAHMAGAPAVFGVALGSIMSVST